MYVSDDRDAKIYAYDLHTGKHLPDLDINSLKSEGNYYPKGLWSDGETVWVADTLDDKVYAYDLDSGVPKPTSDINSPYYNGNLRPAALWSDGITMWVADDEDGKLYAYDLATGVRKAGSDFDTLAAAGNSSPKGIWSDGATMWVADNDDSVVYRYSMPQSAALTSLQLSDVDIGLFSTGRFDYTVRVPNTVTSTTVAAAAAFGESTTVTISPAIDADAVDDGHQVSLSIGVNTITVTAVNGTDTRIYTVKVIGVDAAELTSNADLASLTVADGDVGVFDSAVHRYVASVADSVTRTTVTAMPSESAAEISISPADADPNTADHQVDLDTGANTVTVTVTSTNGESIKDYRVQINRASTADFGWNSVNDFNALWASTSSHEATLWSDGTTMWVADYQDVVVYAYDLATHQRVPGKDINTLRAAVNNNPAGIWSDGSTVWIVDYRDAKVYAYNLATGECLPDLDVNTLDAAGNDAPLGLWSDGTTMWATDYWDAKVYAYNLATGEYESGKDLNGLKAAQNIFPEDLWSDGTTMWVYDHAGHKIYAYNLPAAPLLVSLTLDNIDIGAFNAGRLHYVAHVPSTTTSTTIAASVKFADATLAISPSADADSGTDGQQIALTAGANIITVTVTLGTDTTTYTITIVQAGVTTLSDDASLSGLSLSGVDFGTFDSDTTAYSASVADTVSVTTITATPTDSAAAVTVYPADDDDSVVDGQQINLDSGANLISVTVESSDGTQSRTYQMAVNRAASAAVDWGTLPVSRALASGNSSARAIWSDGTTMWVMNLGDRIYAYNLADMTHNADKDITTLKAAGNHNGNGMWSDGATLCEVKAVLSLLRRWFGRWCGCGVWWSIGRGRGAAQVARCCCGACCGSRCTGLRDSRCRCCRHRLPIRRCDGCGSGAWVSGTARSRGRVWRRRAAGRRWRVGGCVRATGSLRWCRTVRLRCGCRVRGWPGLTAGRVRRRGFRRFRGVWCRR